MAINDPGWSVIRPIIERRSAELEKRLEARDAEHAAQLAEVRAEHEAQLAEVRAEHEAQLAEIRERIDKALAGVDARENLIAARARAEDAIKRGKRSEDARSNKYWHRRVQEIVKPLLEADPDIRPVDLRRVILGDPGRGIPGDLEYAKIKDRPADPVTVEKYAARLKEAWPSSPPWRCRG
jgi:hypothetical protein